MATHAEPAAPDEAYRPDADAMEPKGLSSGSPDDGVSLEAVLNWVNENQTLAMLGAFALGVFVGVLMRD